MRSLEKRGNLEAAIDKAFRGLSSLDVARQWRLFPGQLKEKGRALSGLALDPDFASRPFHNLFTVREPNP